MTVKHLTIGIDGGKTTGLAIWNDKLKSFVSVQSTDFAGAIKFFSSYGHLETAKVVVEIPKVFAYSRNNKYAGAVRDRVMNNVGGNRREAQILADIIEGFGFEVHRVPPIQQRKWSSEQLKRYTGYAGRSNEHTRDAMRIAFHYAGQIIK